MNFGLDSDNYDFSSILNVNDYSNLIRNKVPMNPINIKDSLRTLYCDSIADDFYSNLLDWSSDLIFYSVSDIIYAYNFYTEKHHQVFQSVNSSVTCLKYNKQSNNLCIGTSSGMLNILDINTLKSEKSLLHKSRIGVLENFENKIITGSRDKKGKIIDLRENKITSSLSHHTQEVCGLSVNFNSSLLATGGNDNNIFIYDFRNLETPYAKLSEHVAAVKALSWSPLSKSQLISGGGTADKSIKHWDLNSKVYLQNSYNFESQICNLKWLQSNKILSTFGYSNDDIKLLKNFSIEKKYLGHKNRVIHFSIESSEKYFVSGSADRTVKIWEVEGGYKEQDIKIRG